MNKTLKNYTENISSAYKLFFKFTRIDRFHNIFSKAAPDRRISFLLSSSIFISFVNGRLFKAKHMTKCILIKICINSFSISIKTSVHVAGTINLTYDAMQKLIII